MQKSGIKMYHSCKFLSKTLTSSYVYVLFSERLCPKNWSPNYNQNSFQHLTLWLHNGRKNILKKNNVEWPCPHTDPSVTLARHSVHKNHNVNPDCSYVPPDTFRTKELQRWRGCKSWLEPVTELSVQEKYRKTCNHWNMGAELFAKERRQLPIKMSSKGLKKSFSYPN